MLSIDTTFTLNLISIRIICDLIKMKKPPPNHSEEGFLSLIPIAKHIFLIQLSMILELLTVGRADQCGLEVVNDGAAVDVFVHVDTEFADQGDAGLPCW